MAASSVTASAWTPSCAGWPPISAAEQIWVERIEWQTGAPRSATVSDDAVGETLKVLRRAARDPDYARGARRAGCARWR